ncbi:unnamed protein product [Onchocerca flexuosa]|uniref:Proton-coupled folate transporter n=1 Tax=Onchocerca flexuosa TaxID=387005 RepID=A0A183HZ59_9BILA|nr:unnamed protein product [Onchocerca flexuosa]
MRTGTTDTTAYSAKFLFLKTVRINVPLCLYSITSFMYHPIFQSLVYQKACLQYGDRIGIGVNCSHPEISSNSELQAIANWILLLSGVAICSLGLFTSALIGRFSDTKSRKAALLIPFSGLILEGASLVAQSYYMEVSNPLNFSNGINLSSLFQLSVYWLVGSEALFAAFGGYMSIFSSFFAYATDSMHNYPPKCRSLVIAVLEGVIGFGGTVGYLCLVLLKFWGFVGLFTAFLIIYIICFLAVFFLPSINSRSTAESRSTTEIEYKRDMFGFDLVVSSFHFARIAPVYSDIIEMTKMILSGFVYKCNKIREKRDNNYFLNILQKLLWQQKRIGTFIALIVAFAVSFFTFIGSTHISLYYLKFRFGWDAALYGFLKGPTQGFATLNVLFIYPLLRTHNFTDRTLSLIGVISRALGRLWLAVTWSTSSTFLLMFFDSFARFGASGMRAISANIVPLKNHGSMFTLFAVTEAFSNLIAAVIFHTLFPLSLDFLPQLSFYILAVIMLIPIVILW